MDPRITEKINKIKQDEIDEKNKRAQLQKQRIEENISGARDFVENFLLDHVAQLEVQGIKELDISNYRNPFVENKFSYIPLESLIIAISEIDGLSIKTKYVPKIEGHLFSDDTYDIIEGHYEYYVTWK